MKTSFALWAIALALALFTNIGRSQTNAAQYVAQQVKLYQKGDVILAPFASLRVAEFDGDLESFGGGALLQYHLTDQLALETSFVSEKVYFHDQSFWDSFKEFGLNAKYYLPLSNSGFAPYGLLGWTYDLQRVENRMNAGAGIEYRFSKSISAFGDGQWTHDFRKVGQALFRVGAGYNF
jgi:hypothetical protein